MGHFSFYSGFLFRRSSTEICGLRFVLDLVLAFCILGLRFTHSKSRFNQVPILTVSHNAHFPRTSGWWMTVPVRNCGAELSFAGWSTAAYGQTCFIKQHFFCHLRAHVIIWNNLQTGLNFDTTYAEHVCWEDF